MPQDQQLNKKEIVENCTVLKLAAVDTSRNTVQFMLNHFVNHPDCLDRFKKEICDVMAESSLCNYETFSENEKLQYFTREVLRMYSPVLLLLDRLALKDFKLGKYTIYKGTKISFPTDGIMHDKDYFKDPMTFKFDRYAKDSQGKENLGQNPYLTFSGGKRNCIGRALGELMVQIILVKFIKKFEIKPLVGKGYGASKGTAYGPDNCFIRMKARE